MDNNFSNNEGSGMKLSQDPYGGANQNANPYGDMSQNANPYGDMSQNANPYGSMNQNANPYGDMNQNANPYGSMNQNTNPYGDMSQNANPYGDMNQTGSSYDEVYGNGSYTISSSAISGKKPKKPMTKGKIAAIVGAGVAVVAAAVTAVLVVPNFLKKPKDVVIDAFENTFKADSDASYLSQILGIEDLLSRYYAEGGSTNLSLGINSVTGLSADDEELLAKLDMTGSGVYDPTNKLVNSNIGVAYDGESLISVEMTGDEDNTYFKLPDFIEGYFSVPNKDFLNELMSSPLLQASAGMDEDVLAQIPSMDLDYFMTGESVEESQIVKEYVDAIEGLWDNVEVEKAGKAKIDVNGETITAKEYDIILEEEDIEDALISIVEGAANSIKENEEMFEMYDMSISELESSILIIKTAIPSIISDSFEVKVFVKDDKVVKLTSDNELEIYGVSFGYDIFFDIYDDTINSELKLSSQGEEIGIALEVNDYSGNASGSIKPIGVDEDVSIDFTVEKEDTDSVQRTAVEIRLIDEADQASILYDSSYNKKDDSFALAASICPSADEDGAVVRLDVAGKVTEKEAGVKFNIDFDRLALVVESGDDPVEIDLRLSYGIDTAAAEAKAIGGGATIYDITTLTEDELAGIAASNISNMQAWVERISSLAEKLGLNIGLDDSGMDFGDINDQNADPNDTVSDNENNGEGNYLNSYDGERAVQINGTIAGFELDGASEYSVDFVRDYDYISYELVEGMSASEVIDLMKSTYEDQNVYEVNVKDMATKEVEGNTVYALVFEQMGTFFGFYAVDLGNGDTLVSSVVAMGAESLDGYEKTLSPAYYTVVGE